MTTVVLDLTYIGGYSYVNRSFLNDYGKKVLFASESIVILVAASLMLSRVRPQYSARIVGKIDLRTFHRLTQITYYFLSAIMVTIVIQLFLNAFYSTLLLTEAIALSYCISIFILCVFVFRMARALSTRRNSIIIIMFLAMLATITFNAAITVISISLRISDWAPELRSMQSTGDVSRGRYDVLDELYFLSYIASFVSAWGASAAMLSYYARNLSRIRVWLLALGPLIFFLGQFAVPISIQLSSFTHLDTFSISFITTTISSLSKPIGGLMLAIVFWSMARAKEPSATLKNSLVIAGLGFMLLFTSNQALLLSIMPFPPFGLPTIAIMGLSAYLLVVGVYTSSISIATDANLREIVRNVTKSRLRLLESVVSPNVIKDIENETAEILKRESQVLSKKTGLDPNLDEDEVRAYLKEVTQVIEEDKHLTREGDRKSMDRSS